MFAQPVLLLQSSIFYLSSLKRNPLPPHIFIVCFIIIDFEVLMFLWGRVYSNVRVCHILKLIFFWSLVGQSRGWRVSLRNYPNKSQKLAAMHDFSQTLMHVSITLFKSDNFQIFFSWHIFTKKSICHLALEWVNWYYTPFTSFYKIFDKMKHLL